MFKHGDKLVFTCILCCYQGLKTLWHVKALFICYTFQ